MSKKQKREIRYIYTVGIKYLHTYTKPGKTPRQAPPMLESSIVYGPVYVACMYPYTYTIPTQPLHALVTTSS